MPNNAHIKFKTNGNSRKRELFDYTIGAMDADYPYAPQSVIRSGKRISVCLGCGGRIWTLPLLSEEICRAVADQIDSQRGDGWGGHLMLRVKMWKKEIPDCQGHSTRYLDELYPSVKIVGEGSGQETGEGQEELPVSDTTALVLVPTPLPNPSLSTHPVMHHQLGETIRQLISRAVARATSLDSPVWIDYGGSSLLVHPRDVEEKIFQAWLGAPMYRVADGRTP